jgi:hypothetical protein
VTDPNVHVGKFGVKDPHTQPVQPPAAEISSGITVEEEVLRTVSAQLIYQLRCECGRSWFALELPTIVTCPACRKLGVVSL